MSALTARPMSSEEDKIVILGVGNLLWGDDGFGVRAVQALHNQWRFPPRVELVDGGTMGFTLLHHVQAAQRLLVFDAIDYGLPPGTLKVLSNQQVPRFMGAKKLSLHQTGFQEVLAVADLNERLPAELVLIGVQPMEFRDFGGSLDASVKAQIQPALEVALACLRRWGAAPEPRRDAVASLLPGGLDLAVYEAVAPGAD